MLTTVMIAGEHVPATRQADGVLVTSCPKCDGRVIRVTLDDGRRVLADDTNIDGPAGTGPFVALDHAGAARASIDGHRREGESLHDLHRLTCPFRVAL